MKIIVLSGLLFVVFVSPTYSQILGDRSSQQNSVIMLAQNNYLIIDGKQTEGTATVGPERFFVGGKEVPKGTPGATSGDELARQRIPRETTPDLRLPKKSYYEVHPEERARDDAAQANKPLMDMQKKLIEDMRTRQQGYGGEIHRDHPSRSSPPPTPPGAIDVRTGQFYPGVPGGIINPNTGQFLPDVGGGYIDPSTGRFIPKQ